MRDVINRLFAKVDQQKKFATVVKPLGVGRYQVEDDQLRLKDVDGDSGWLPGDGVTILQGRIVSRAAKFLTPKVYEV